MFDVVIVVGLLALLGFCGEAHKGWRAGLENMVMFILAVASYFCALAVSVAVISFYLFNLGGWEAITAYDKVKL